MYQFFQVPRSLSLSLIYLQHAEMHWTFDEILVRFFSAAFVFVNDLNPLNKFISVELWAFIFYLCFKLVKTTETCLFYSLSPYSSIQHSAMQWVCFIDADMVGNAAFHEKVHYFRFGMHVCACNVIIDPHSISWLTVNRLWRNVHNRIK